MLQKLILSAGIMSLLFASLNLPSEARLSKGAKIGIGVGGAALAGFAGYKIWKHTHSCSRGY